MYKKGDKKGMALQRWCSGMICDGCEHLSIAWPGTVSVTQECWSFFRCLHCDTITVFLCVICLFLFVVRLKQCHTIDDLCWYVTNTACSGVEVSGRCMAGEWSSDDRKVSERSRCCPSCRCCQLSRCSYRQPTDCWWHWSFATFRYGWCLMLSH